MNNSLNTESQLREVHALIDSERFSELLVRTEQCLRSSHPPGIGADLRRARALAYTGLGDWKAAVEEWSKVIELLPDRASSYRGRGAARERAGDSAGAVADFARAVELNIPNAVARDILPKPGVYNDVAWTRALVGYANDVSDRRQQARGFCCCGGGHQGPQIVSESYVKRGYCDRAEDTFTHTLEENPDNAQAWFDRASVRHCKRNWAGVIADCTRAVALQPEFAAAYSLRGSAYDKKGELVQAVADWTRALELCPEDVISYSLRALAYESLGEEEKARGDRVRAFELSARPKQP